MTSQSMPSGEFRCSKNRGRPKSADPLIFKTVGLTQAQWDWLSLWAFTGNPSRLLSELLDRAMKFWPAGPFLFGHRRKSQ
ncbi:hypothetical protein [Trichlorobacter ammonificans]|uniref:Transposase n=1 Tax=Trichlorobacter ammonificans TaxID=2916410 RepID=A0ABN8HGZ1_9BACT|nr:hypothetical protein [Trichlorobacter ammonificans]CAH2032098.1 protein of unknown function [Trichlorobacter ammonificans]